MIIHIWRLMQNILWLFLSVGGAFLFARAVSWEAPVIGTGETLLLCVALLGGGLSVDTLGKSKQRSVPLSKSFLAVLVAAVLLLAFSLSRTLDIPPVGFIIPALLFFCALRCVSALLAKPFVYPDWLSHKVILLGNDPSLDKTREIMAESRGKYRLEMHIPVWLSPHGALQQNCDDLVFMATEHNVDTLIVSFSDRRGTMPISGLMRCRMWGMSVLDVPTFFEQATRKLYLEKTTPGWFIFSPGFRVSLLWRAGKRFFDIAGSAFGLLLLSPFMPLIALAIRLDSPGPVLFRQERTGLGGRSFTIIKFRTMRKDAEKATGAVWAAEQDPRITRVGRLLRRTRLDEIPQLFNVLFGDMSLVGPRPERPEFIRELEKDIPFYAERHCVRPGVTGWAQVRYRYGASVEDALEKLRYDLYYIKNQSFLLDLEIVLRTIAVIVLRMGAR